MNFLGAVNRVLVNNLVIKGDDDLITSFNSTQHEGTIRFARNAVTSELNILTSFFTFPNERATGQITTVDGTRVYTLPSDFVRFYLDNPYLYLDTDASQRCYEYGGGEAKLRQEVARYLTDEGFENWWYWADASAKSIALYQVPDASDRIWKFEYEKQVGVVNATDDLPLQTEQEGEVFADMASRRYKYLINDNLDVAQLEQDSEYLDQRGALFNLMQPKVLNRRYGRLYR